jgi:CDP-6-deoxy-D-xylo-4-hexulose-3-dehydrase
MPHPLMKNNILRSDLNKVIAHLKKKDPMLTQHKNVRTFESRWSKWLGVKYSVFVNSGASANYITLKILSELKPGTEVIVSPLNWISDISSIIMFGLKPIFADVNPKNLCLDFDLVKKKITSKTSAILLTHIQGFNGLSKDFLDLIKKNKIFLIEDVCESHGAKFNNKKLGTFGWISNFSFYYAHHLSTIEGGMICTNDIKIYEIARMFRSHGMVREIDNKKIRTNLEKKYPELNKKFIFEYPGFNMRNTEIGGIIGINQLKRLDANNKQRFDNFKYFLENLDSRTFYKDFDIKGSCNYALLVVLNNNKNKYILRKKLEKIMDVNNIEYRRGTAGGGNHLRQPYLKKIYKNLQPQKFKYTDHFHFFGYYIGNYPSLKKKHILKITNILNSINI